MLKKIPETIHHIISSKKFFYVVVGLLIIQAAWFALTARYPMAFDENYHFGVIQIYSHQWTPFITNTPPDSGAFGDLTRFGSYMYHYLMSFPYRLIATFIHQQVAQIIILRFINIGLFVGGLLLFRQLFSRLNISRGLINFSLLMLVLIPIVPFLAATINYDNLVFLLVPLVASLTLACRDGIVRHSKIPAASLVLLLITCGLASLVKYAFLPIFAAIALYLVIIFFRAPEKRKLIKTIGSSLMTMKRSLQIILIIGVIISGGLFIERYGSNLIQYHRFEPDCSKVQSVSHCMQYGPWARNHNAAIKVTTTNPAFDPPILSFIPNWIGGMVYRLYFAINYNYYTNSPLPIPITVASFIGGIGLILCAIFWWSIIRIDRRLLLFGAIVVLYIGGVFYANLGDYLHYRKMYAINGRYFIVILPLLFVLIGSAYYRFFDKIFKASSRPFIAVFSVVIILLLTQGGGATTHLVQSSENWYWQNRSVIDFNMELKKIISPLIIGTKQPVKS